MKNLVDSSTGQELLARLESARSIIESSLARPELTAADVDTLNEMTAQATVYEQLVREAGVKPDASLNLLSDVVVGIQQFIELVQTELKPFVPTEESV